MTAAAGTTLADRIDAMERAFEFMLGYARQERADETQGQPSPIRDYLKIADDALDGLSKITAGALGAPVNGKAQAAYDAVLRVVHEDALKTREAIALALSQPRISSRLIDNINASVHIRALLTDLFLIDEALKSGTA